MAATSEDALASLLLTQRLVDAGERPFSSRDYWDLIERVPQPSALLRHSLDELVDERGLPPAWVARLERLLSVGTALAIELEALERKGLQALSPFHNAYPERLTRTLGTAAPPIMYVAGPTTLLTHESIAIVGSRNVDDAGARVAQKVAVAAAQRGLTVVSGGAKGTDQLAMSAATQSGGTVVGVLADGLDRRLRQPDVRRVVTREQACLMSPYKPSAGFTVANAMARNKLIYALARTTLVIAADVEKGGTWAGAVEAMRRSYGSVAVWTGPGAGEGNRLLIDKGARPVSDPTEVFEVLDDTTDAAPLGQLQIEV